VQRPPSRPEDGKLARLLFSMFDGFLPPSLTGPTHLQRWVVLKDVAFLFYAGSTSTDIGLHVCIRS
jgi:hypothetical protein